MTLTPAVVLFFARNPSNRVPVVVVEQTPTRLVLRGVPGSWRWMLLATLIGMLLTAVVGWFARDTYRREGFGFPMVSMGVGLIVAQVMFWTGAVTLAVGRLELVLDTGTGNGEYKVRSPIVERGKPCRFELKHVDSVTIERVKEPRPQSVALVDRARLRLDRPRRAITLDESQNGRRERIEAIATIVAAFLGKAPERIDEL